MFTAVKPVLSTSFVSKYVFVKKELANFVFKSTYVTIERERNNEKWSENEQMSVCLCLSQCACV